MLCLTYPLIGNYGVPADTKDDLGLPIYFESTVRCTNNKDAAVSSTALRGVAVPEPQPRPPHPACPTSSVASEPRWPQ